MERTLTITALPISKPDELPCIQDDVRARKMMVVIKIDEHNFVKIFPKSHMEFLNGIKSPVKRGARGKKEESEGLKKFKKTEEK
ncbi:hypothetical protein BG005_004197 [Podila minutissima]|nr:hypothetical protein BG005_004197 [Podila minutissima]